MITAINGGDGIDDVVPANVGMGEGDLIPTPHKDDATSSLDDNR